MKDQYVGDINDYRKYGLLRELAAGWRPTICWMLTPGDGRGDGGRIDYLRDPERWRACDPRLFDALRGLVIAREDRRVRAIEAAAILPGARFHSLLLSDDSMQRARYFARLWARAHESELVFFDPDNGLEVRSCPYGGRGSARYLYWREVAAAWARGLSVLIYQHFPRVSRGEYLERRAGELLQCTGARRLYSFSTSHVVFFFLPQPRCAGRLARRLARIRQSWGEQIAIAEHGDGCARAR